MAMTNEELLDAVRKMVGDAMSQATAAVTNANAAINTAANAATVAANAAQASAGAQAGVAGARTQSNIESAVDRAMSTISQQVESDIDSPEAWKANLKRTYDIHQTDERESFSRNRLHFDNMLTQLQTHVANLNQMTIQSLANNQNQSNLGNLQAIAHRDLATDREWNINETDLSAKSAAVLSDAILAGVAKNKPATE